MAQVEYIPGYPNRPEFGGMFGGWLTRQGGFNIIVDCGVGSGGASMVAGLKALGLDRLDYILLTHIHLDHAGGLNDLLAAYPEAKVVAHKKGLRHLASPARLWESTKQVMGELADMYGELNPVPQDNLIAHDEADLPDLKIIETPGHAPHHISFFFKDVAFIGEAAGCPYILDGQIYARPATPPRYFPKVTLASIDRLLLEPDQPAYFSHFKELIPYKTALEKGRKQLLFWDEFLRRPESDLSPGETHEEHLQRLIEALFEADHNLRPLNSLPPVDLWREKYFMQNSIEGFLLYYKEGEKA